MGGYGSGRPKSWGAKDTTDACLALDVRKLHRKGRLTVGSCLSLNWTRGDKPAGSISMVVWDDHLELRYNAREGGGDWRPVSEVVRLDQTPCNYGGERIWFLCPKCNRRAAILYGPGHLFWCRRCCKLAYSSQRESTKDRAREKAEAIRRRLGGRPGLAWPFPERPKGMHYRTYERLRQEYHIAERVDDAAVWEWLDASQGWLDKHLAELKGKSGDTLPAA